MTPDTALKILSLPRTAAADQINVTYRRLAARHHPDRPGGSLQRMRELNVARDVALAALGQQAAFDAFWTAAGRWARNEKNPQEATVDQQWREITAVRKEFWDWLMANALMLKGGYQLSKTIDAEIDTDCSAYIHEPARRAEIWTRHLARLTLIKEMQERLALWRCLHRRELARARKARKS